MDYVLLCVVDLFSYSFLCCLQKRQLHSADFKSGEVHFMFVVHINCINYRALACDSRLNEKRGRRRRRRRRRRRKDVKEAERLAEKKIYGLGISV